MVQSADLILLNGAGFATWIDRVSLPRARLVNTSAAFEDQFIVTESITHSHGDGGEHSHEGLASFTWLDPTLAIAQAEAISAAIIARDLAPSGDVTERLEALKADLEALDSALQEGLSDESQLTMIATHPRYQYFARRYGLTIEALNWDAGAMPTDEQLGELAALVQESGASVLIWEARPPADAVAAVADLGLKSVVFPTLAHKPDGGDFLEAFASEVISFAQND